MASSSPAAGLRPLAIRAVRPAGRQPTYEVTLRAPWHNYLAEGVLTSNSHAVAYGHLAYRLAYLKAHHPAAFWAATLNHASGQPEQMERHLAAARRQGVRILPPDINVSGGLFVAVGDAVRCGLRVVKGIGDAAVEQLLQIRQGGAFLSLADLVARLPGSLATSQILENLIRAGALDGLEGSRAQKMLAVEMLLEWRRERLQTGGTGTAPGLPVCPEWTRERRLLEERLATGVWLTGHPLDGWQPVMRALGCVESSVVERLEAGKSFRLGGIVAAVEEREIRRGPQQGEKFGLVTVEDGRGSIRLHFWAQAWKAGRSHLHVGQKIVITGKVTEGKDGKPLVTGGEVLEWSAAVERLPALTIVGTGFRLPELLEQISERFPGPGSILSGHGDAARSSELLRLYVATRGDDGSLDFPGGSDAPPILITRAAGEWLKKHVREFVEDGEVFTGRVSSLAGAGSLVMVWSHPRRNDAWRVANRE